MCPCFSGSGLAEALLEKGDPEPGRPASCLVERTLSAASPAADTPVPTQHVPANPL